MKLQDALNILNIHGQVTNAILKTAYRHATSIYHPDRNPAGLEMMKAVNLAWEALKDIDFDNDTIIVEESPNNDYGDALNDALNVVQTMEGIEIEICGAWVWLTGNTYANKKILKDAGYKWAPKKKQWYFRPEEYKSFNRNTWSMDEIREQHGSFKVRKNETPRINA